VLARLALAALLGALVVPLLRAEWALATTGCRVVGQRISVRGWPEGPLAPYFPAAEVVVRLPTGDLLRSVVPAIWADGVPDQVEGWWLERDGELPVARLEGLPATPGRDLLGFLVAWAALRMAVVALLRLGRAVPRWSLWRRGEERSGLVREAEVRPRFRAGRPTGFSVDVTWEVPLPGGRTRVESVRDFRVPRRVLFEPGQPLRIVQDTRSGRSLPAHFFPK